MKSLLRTVAWMTTNFLIALLIISSVLTLLYLSEYLGFREPVATAAYILQRALVPAVLTALYVTLFRLVRLEARILSALFSLALLGGGLLIAVGMLSLVLDTPAQQRPNDPPAPTPERIYRVGAARLYFSRGEGLLFEDVVLMRSRERPVMQFFPEAVLDPDEHGLQLLRPESSSEFLRFAASDSPFRSAPRAPAFLLPVLRDSVALRSHFLLTLNSSLLFGAVLAFALSTYLAAGFVFVRLSRWPLFNALLSLIVLRLSMLLYAAVSVPAFTEFVVGFLPMLPSELVVPIVLATATLVLCLLMVPLPRYRDWRKGVGYA